MDKPHVRARGVALDDDQTTRITQKLGAKLSKFASSIERVSVRLADVNGPRGGVDQRCRIKVVLSGLPSVVVEGRDASIDAAIDTAVRATEESVRRVVGRRRMKPLRRRSLKSFVDPGVDAAKEGRERSRLVRVRRLES